MYRIRSWAFILVAFGAVSQSANAVPITDTVLIGGKEWAQVDLFTSLSWNDINAVCPAGDCDNGTGDTLNLFDMDGWEWASQTQVGDLVFGPLTSHPGGSARSSDSGDTISPFLASTGFRATFATGAHIFIDGLSSDPLDFAGQQTTAFAAWTDASFPGTTPLSGWVTDAGGLIAANAGGSTARGAWLFRADVTTVPEPATLSLLGLGLAGIGWSRRKTNQ